MHFEQEGAGLDPHNSVFFKKKYIFIPAIRSCYKDEINDKLYREREREREREIY